ncbi:hypothetical protein AVEN_150374-1 [Araneus ventricosus]|uniref:Uncharacterized protein n=1 Tax=Araneus ventricosus TaxID=182803 RepID=A0A4Y2CQ26_ARAVE|nr:hypothetical protein AVEN_150374-1 [Araneus ventricosus]
MEGYRGSSSSSSSSSSNDGHQDVSSSSGWPVRPVKGEEAQEDTVGGGAVPSSTSDTSSPATGDISPTSKAQEAGLDAEQNKKMNMMIPNGVTGTERVKLLHKILEK